MSEKPAERSLTRIAAADLRALLRAIERGRVGAPLRRVELDAEGFGALAGPLLAGLAGLDQTSLVVALELVLAERAERSASVVDLVWTGPEARHSTARDTAVVLRELFTGAQRSVLIAGFRFDHGKALFEPLHAAMKERGVRVRLLMDIDRRPRDPDDPDACAASFGWRFFKRQWPWESPQPELWYDPRTAERGKAHGASMHAKVVIVDEARTLIGSANFTERGQTRNIEAGALIEDTRFAVRLGEHFQRLMNGGFLRRLPGAGAAPDSIDGS